MQVHTSGRNSKLSRKELRYATKFMSGLMMSKQLCDNLFIKVHSIKNLTQEGKPIKACVIARGTAPLPRRFSIYISTKHGKREQLLALAHEITHIKQYARGELKDIGNAGLSKWKRETYNEEKIDYFFLPWEIESYGYERGLYHSYRQHIKEAELEF